MDSEQKQNLVNRDGSINIHSSFSFTLGKSKGKELKVIATDGTDRTIWDCLDTVKNLKTGKYTQIERYKLEKLKPVINKINIFLYFYLVGITLFCRFAYV